MFERRFINHTITFVLIGYKATSSGRDYVLARVIGRPLLD
jgi:hypothetical protein